ncbi:MAG: tRNA (adenosine(37)-N6)-dimethylallyltransferase MiaA [Rhodobacteraceae bacterium]|nr:tRNA (adenosine(37)-N6)-dimethylallyltransferase MiaA [Paracoccaceae bacterium]
MDFASVPPERPVLIAGSTASGKTELALSIAEAAGGVIINADALQVYDGWHVLTSRPGPEEEARAPHLLYGHVPFDASYSVGSWLRDVAPHLRPGGPRPIIVGGTGLYFRALTEGLAEIPAIPSDVREEAEATQFETLLAELDRVDPVLASRIDRRNRVRVQRGWEVWRTTGTPLSVWQDATAAPLLPLAGTTPLLMDADADWLAKRISRRFDRMLAHGVLDEAHTNLPRWSHAGGAAKAIGAQELMAHLRGELSLEDVRKATIIATRQYAKRQRTWFRARMTGWRGVAIP